MSLVHLSFAEALVQQDISGLKIVVDVVDGEAAAEHDRNPYIPPTQRMLDFRCFPSASRLKNNILRAEWERLKRRRIPAFLKKAVNQASARNRRFRSLFAEILQSWGLG